MRKGNARILKMPPLAGDKSVHEQLAAYLRGLIETGAISSGARMPAQRNLAKNLHVSRNTVTAAYELLFSEGMLETRKGSGTFVLPSKRAPIPFARPQGLRELLPLQQGVPDLESFPRQEWRRIQDRIWRGIPASALGYGDPAGLPELRLVLAQRFAGTRGVRRTAEQVFIVSSTADAVRFACSLLKLHNKDVLVECPGYEKFHATLRACGARARAAAVDHEGMVLPTNCSAAAVIATPSAQFPLGMPMSPRRRAALRAWASETDAWIIEDDYEGDFCFESEAVAPMAAHKDAERVLYIASLNNVMFPSLQVAAVAVPDALVDSAQKALRAGQASTNTVTQMVAHEFINEGFLARHIRKSQDLFADRRAHLRALLRANLDGIVTLNKQPMGLHVTALVKGFDDLELEQLAAADGLTVNSITRFAAPLGISMTPALVMGFAAYPNAVIGRSVSKLMRVIETAAST